jgi:hypothetical protein
VVNAELAPPIREDRAAAAPKVAPRRQEISGEGLRTDFAAVPSVTFEPAPAGFATFVMEFPVARPIDGVPTPLTRLTFVGVAEHSWSAQGFEHLGDDAGHRRTLIEYFDSARLRRMRSTGGRMGHVALGLRHFRIGFAGHGDYDVLCRDVRIGHIPHVDQVDGLTPRAAEFLRRHATRHVCYVDPEQERKEVAQAAEDYLLPLDTVMTKLAHLQRRFGGLRYKSPSWSFEETIGFAPALDLDDEDTEPMVILIEHTAAHPFGVWATLDGAVHFMYPGDHGGEYVHVFDRIEAIIESDALMAECAEWIEVRRGGGDTIRLIEAKVDVLSRLDEASGHTESWWLGDGFRVHVSRTMGRVFGMAGDGKWAVWAENEAAVEKARAFLSA